MADPGFPRGGGVNPGGGGHQPVMMGPIFSCKLHENKVTWVKRERVSKIRACRSAAGNVSRCPSLVKCNRPRVILKN